MLHANLSGMLTQKTTLTDVGVVCSIGSYYCLVKGADLYFYPSSKEFLQDKQKSRLLLGTAAGLKVASLACLVAPRLPKLVQDPLGPLILSLEEAGSFMVGTGLYLLEGAFKKYRNETLYSQLLKNEAKQDCALGVFLITFGSVHLSMIYMEDKLEKCYCK